MLFSRKNCQNFLLSVPVEHLFEAFSEQIVNCLAGGVQGSTKFQTLSGINLGSHSNFVKPSKKKNILTVKTAVSQQDIKEHTLYKVRFSFLHSLLVKA